ncbi:hypothetical protein BDQ94DRAFT_154661 [Aspergillus welwitschiae]|uniref:Uncharacterized protein n=1 Tax=Aspergillus welwitschiae TaxID=1341132 RepID=A0A3F3PL03_9EURO|nr:hypothetical protein BDQ94DRAFT_154661 [Aspergillus welwitschiae]RDH27016.1 hypothetical protein BDQ94DRAFT_154661 [Aspergillus welwitschiae]
MGSTSLDSSSAWTAVLCPCSSIGTTRTNAFSDPTINHACVAIAPERPGEQSPTTFCARRVASQLVRVHLIK